MQTIVKIYRWREVQKYLEERLAELHKKIEQNPPEIVLLVGQARALREMIHLETTLTFLEESNEPEK